jgi:hypothetical protein
MGWKPKPPVGPPTAKEQLQLALFMMERQPAFARVLIKRVAQRFTRHRDGSETYLQGEKRCTRCRAVKPMAEFGYRKMTPHGSERRPQAQCRSCRSKKK